jgi:hypothetical protein
MKLWRNPAEERVAAAFGRIGDIQQQEYNKSGNFRKAASFLVNTMYQQYSDANCGHRLK